MMDENCGSAVGVPRTGPNRHWYIRMSEPFWLSSEFVDGSLFRIFHNSKHISLSIPIPIPSNTSHNIPTMSDSDIPRTQKQWVVQGTDKGFDGMVLQQSAAVPQVGENEVLVKFRGASLNFRDLIIPRVSNPFSYKPQPPPQKISKSNTTSRANTSLSKNSPSSPAPTAPARSWPSAPR